LFPNISSENEYFDDDNNENNDNLIKKYMNNNMYQCTDIENVKKLFEVEKVGAYISLEKHFEKGFFKKGQKWNKAMEKYFGYNNISILINIIVKNNLFCIEIENVTHPLYGQILLDLDKLEIVKE
jgi:hypothetical protein